MPTSTQDIIDLDRQNLLTMPSSQLQPMATYVLVYKAGWSNVGSISLERIQKALDRSPDLFALQTTVPIESALGIAVRMRTRPQNTVVEAVTSQIKTLAFDITGGASGTLRLTHMIPLSLKGTLGTTQSKDAVARIVAVAKQSPAQRSDPLGIQKVARGVDRTVRDVFGTLKWVSFGIIAIVVLYLLMEAKKSKLVG